MMSPRTDSGRRAVGPWLRAALLALVLALPASAQDEGSANLSEPQVDVVPVAPDEGIGARISDILDATGWFDATDVTVDDGVVFLDGQTDSDAHRDWAHALALRTEGVVAVVDRIEVVPEAAWSFTPALGEIRRIAQRSVAALPLVVLAILILPLAWFAASGVARLMRWLLAGRIPTPFLRDVVARGLAVPVFLAGLYVVLQIAGLTQLALSLLGGAGVLGIVVGFAFRDIAENFLASLLLSIRKPFQRGDLIEVAGQRGFVQSMNTRSTVLVSADGNHIQIPNATVFKNIIVNLTAAPNQRGDLSIGIGYDASIGDAQRLIADTLRAHRAVCDDPEPMALVDSLGASTVNMKGYYWFDGRSYSPLKLRSMLLRQVKTRLSESGISMPDEAREVIFPEGIPLIRAARIDTDEDPAPATPRRPDPVEESVTVSEYDLSSDVGTLGPQMDTPVEEGGADLLKS